MKTVFLLALSVTVATIANAQSSVIEAQQNFRVLTGNSTYRTFNNRDKTPQGTPNVFKDYLPGAIKMTSGQKLLCDQMNYDGYYDELIVVKDGQDLTVNTTVVRSFYVIDDTDTLFFERLVNPDNTMGFYQRLMNGSNVKLYKKHVRNLKPPESSGAFGTGKTVAEFISANKYFVRDGTLRLQEFKNRKSLLTVFPEEETRLLTFIKEKKIIFQEEQDLVTLITYLNRLRLGDETH